MRIEHAVTPDICMNNQGSSALGQGANQEYKLFATLAFVYVSKLKYHFVRKKVNVCHTRQIKAI